MFAAAAAAAAAKSSAAAAAGEGGAGSAEVPWVEKYRPRSLAEVAHQDEVTKALRHTMDSGQLPHMLFYGPPGTGKTSTILAAARELYGPALMRQRVLELNASNERGIDVIRHKVKSFAQAAVGTARVAGHPCPPYKIVILDEADSMTRDAQSALRRTMEVHSKITRFCIICNYVSRIIEPIASRCAKFRYKPLSTESMTRRLEDIAGSEGIRLGEGGVRELVRVSRGDMRKSITVMQSAHRLVGAGGELTPALVVEVAGTVPEQAVARLMDACRANSFGAVQDAASECVMAGFPADRVLAQFQAAVVAADDLSDRRKAQVCLRIAEADSKLVQGADEELQLLDVLSVASRAYQAGQ